MLIRNHRSQRTLGDGMASNVALAMGQSPAVHASCIRPDSMEHKAGIFASLGSTHTPPTGSQTKKSQPLPFGLPGPEVGMTGGQYSKFTTVFRADETRRGRRNRHPVSCTACQRRKSKCDRQQPCSACERRGDGATCRFSRKPAADGGKLPGTGISGGIARNGTGRKEIQFRLSKLEQLVKNFADAETGLAADQTRAGAENTWNGLQVLPEQPQEQFQYQFQYGVQQGSQPPSSLSSAQEEIGHASDPRSWDHTVLSSESGGASNYRGPTSWTALMSGIRDIKSLLEADGEDSDVDELPFADDLEVLISTDSTLTIADAVAALPSREDADQLVAAYFRAKFVALPFLHQSHFRRRYESFWANPYTPGLGLLWMSILFSVLSFGATILQTQDAEAAAAVLPTMAQPRMYLSVSARCLAAGHYLRARTYAVEALVIHAHCRNVQNADADSTLWSLYGVAVRLAQKRGYHREPGSLSLTVSPFDAEMRRRVWFVVQSADLLFSFQHGLPPMIDEAMCDVSHPLALSDEEFDEDSPEPFPPDPVNPTEPKPSLAYAYKSRLARLVRRVMRLALHTEPQPYSETLTLQAELERWHASVPACLHMVPIRDTPASDPNFTVMHRLMLEMMYQKSLCILHRPFLSLHKGDSTYDGSRRICRDAALRLLNVHVEFDVAIKPGGRMYADRYMVASLTYHHFLLAAMVLCLDLSESTHYRYGLSSGFHIPRSQT